MENMRYSFILAPIIIIENGSKMNLIESDVFLFHFLYQLMLRVIDPFSQANTTAKRT